MMDPDFDLPPLPCDFDAPAPLSPHSYWELKDTVNFSSSSSSSSSSSAPPDLALAYTEEDVKSMCEHGMPLMVQMVHVVLMRRANFNPIQMHLRRAKTCFKCHPERFASTILELVVATQLVDLGVFDTPELKLRFFSFILSTLVPYWLPDFHDRYVCQLQPARTPARLYPVYGKPSSISVKMSHACPAFASLKHMPCVGCGSTECRSHLTTVFYGTLSEALGRNVPHGHNLALQPPLSKTQNPKKQRSSGVPAHPKSHGRK